MSSIITTGGLGSARSCDKSQQAHKNKVLPPTYLDSKPIKLPVLINTAASVRQNYYNLPKLNLKNILRKGASGYKSNQNRQNSNKSDATPIDEFK